MESYYKENFGDADILYSDSVIVFFSYYILIGLTTF